MKVGGVWCYVYSLYELIELSQWPSHVNNTINIVIGTVLVLKAPGLAEP